MSATDAHDHRPHTEESMTERAIDESGRAGQAGPATAATLPLVQRPPRREATAAVLAATLLGIAGDALFRAPALGINVLLWVGAALVATWWVARGSGRSSPRGAWLLAAPILFFAAVFAWRSAGALVAFNLLALLTAFGLLAFALSGWPARLRQASIGEMIVNAVSLAMSGAFGAPMLVWNDRALADGTARPRWRGSMSVARGVLIALPLLLVFGALLASADPRFETLLDSLIDIDFGQTISHIVLAGFIAWWAAGYLRAATVAERPLGLATGWHPPRMTLGTTELATALGLVDALFALFVAIQLPHLFGGLARVQQVAGLTVAEYARGGFFQLVMVAALVLPLLIVSAALVKRDGARDWAVFRGLAVAMIALVAVMVASAFQRHALYVSVFGLTEDRVYATAIVVWLAIVFALLIATVLRRRDAGFALAALLSGWLVLAALDVVNPQALIVRVNADRAAAGAAFDWAYARQLDADATPALVDAMARLDAPSRCAVAATLAQFARDRSLGLPEDWRSWNSSRVRAFAVANAAQPFRALATCPTKVASP
jgi:hypothetical protein